MEFRFKRGASVVLNGPGRRANIKGIVVARFSYANTGQAAYYVKTADYFPLRVDECHLDAVRFRIPSHSMPTAPANALARAMVTLTGAANAFRHAEQSENPEAAADIAAARVLALAHEPMYNFARHHQHSLINISTLETVKHVLRLYGTQEIDAKLYALPVCLKCGFEDELAIMVPCGCIAHVACILDICTCGIAIERTVVSQPLNTYLAIARAALTDERNKILSDADTLI